MKRLIIILILIPLLSFAADKHMKVEEGRECNECHTKEYEDWQGSAHGVNVMPSLFLWVSSEVSFLPSGHQG